MKPLWYFIRLGAAAMAAFQCMCSMFPLAGGNSSQTGNNGIAVSSCASTVSGTAAPGSLVSMYSATYLPFTNPPGWSDSTVADTGGHFAFSGLSDGYRNLLVRDASGAMTAFIQGIRVAADSTAVNMTATLRHPGFCNGTATDRDGKILPLSYVYIPGSPFYTVARNDGNFLLGPLPAGGYSLSFFGNFKVVGPNITQLAPLLTTVADSGVTVVAPDSISEWHW